MYGEKVRGGMRKVSEDIDEMELVTWGAELNSGGDGQGPRLLTGREAVSLEKGIYKEN